MSIQREPIFAALAARLGTLPGVVTFSRRLRHWNDVAAVEQPAVFLAQGAQNATTDTGLPTIWTLSADLYVYVRTDGGQDPGPILNQVLDAIDAALAPDNDVAGRQTLGGLVHYCRIEGAIETDEGTLGDQAVAIIPISILV